jgi:predicted nucleotidyltransferase/biotin operon repressor
LDIPVQDADLFGSDVVDDLLVFLSEAHEDSFSITALAEAVDYSRPAVTKAVDTLSANDLIVDEREGTKRMVQINTERLFLPENPYFKIPQDEFRAPVRTAVETLQEKLDGVIGVVLYGSVARGEGDRRSDIDLWVLVQEDRMEKQRAANRLRQDLENEEFGAGRFAYEIDVEGIGAIPNYLDEIQQILTDGITLYETGEFQTVRRMALHGESNE